MDVAAAFKRAAADAKGQAVSPSVGTTEWNQWLEWLNEEYQTNAEVHDWAEYRDLNNLIQSPQSGTSVGLGDRFKKLAGSPIILGKYYKEVDSDQYDKYDSSEQVARVGYNGGWYLEWKKANVSGTSVIVPLVRYPSSLATSTDNIIFRNPDYLVKRLKVRIFKYRQDPIFTEIESEADLMLQQLLENEYYKHSQYEAGATTPEQEQGFTLGID